MSKVISFSISDRYLAKIRSLYPSLTDNLAAKQFLTDRLDSSLGSSSNTRLDEMLDGQIETMIEARLNASLDERLDATVGKLSGSLNERLTRLESRLDDMEPLLKLQREASIASPSPSPSPDKTIDGIREPDSSIDEPDRLAIESFPFPFSPDEPNAIEVSIAPIPGTDETVETDSSIETGTNAIATLSLRETETMTTVETGIEKDETVETNSSINTVTNAIETAIDDTSPFPEPNQPAIDQKLTYLKMAALLGCHSSNLSKWIKTGHIPKKYRDKCQFNHNKTKIVLI